MDQMDRLRLQIKEKNLEKLKKSSVLVLGLGGVGSYALEALARSFVGNLIIVDKDIIDITNLNRQLMSLHSNIGKYKVDVWEDRIKDINPNINVVKIKENILIDNINLLFTHKIDYIIDACDTIATKKELIKECYKRKIKLISSMGTGNKLDPTKLQIKDLRKTSYDPIAKILRKMVKEEKIKVKIPVVYSEEEPIKTKKNIISSNSFVPATAGLLCAGYIINDLIDMDVIYE